MANVLRLGSLPHLEYDWVLTHSHLYDRMCYGFTFNTFAVLRRMCYDFVFRPQHIRNYMVGSAVSRILNTMVSTLRSEHAVKYQIKLLTFQHVYTPSM